jgi:hypothetical protein
MQTKIVGYIGKRGLGKTTRLKNEIYNNELEAMVFLPFDTLDENQFADDRENEVYLYTDEKEFIQDLRAEVSERTEKKKNSESFEELNIFIDEIDMFFLNKEYYDLFYHLANYSRHYHIHIYYTLRRPQNIDINLRAQTTHFYISKITEMRDIKMIAEYLGLEKKEIEELKKMKIGQFKLYEV